MTGGPPRRPPARSTNEKQPSFKTQISRVVADRDLARGPESGPREGAVAWAGGAGTGSWDVATVSRGGEARRGR